MIGIIVLCILFAIFGVIGYFIGKHVTDSAHKDEKIARLEKGKA